MLLRSPAEYEQAKADEGEITHFTDPRLIRNEAAYAKFLSYLWKRGCSRFKARRSATVGILFVAKKDGKQRVIFDTRAAN